MPRFEPFPGIRYATADGDLSAVVAPPYDVISPEDQARLEDTSEHNSVRLELPRDEAARDRYRAASARLAEWLDDSVLVRDEPSFYVYRMRYPDEAGQLRHTLGVIGALGLEPPGEGDVLPHERTTPKALDDRLELVRATRTNLSPVWGLSMASGLSARLEPDGPPLVTAVDEDGIGHDLWKVSDPDAISAIEALVAYAPVVIADGHHRYQTGLAYEVEGGDGLIMAYIVELAEDELSVRAIHRLINGLPAGFDFVDAFSRWFELTPTGPVDPSIGSRMLDAGALALVTRDGVSLMRPLPAVADAAEADLDSSRLDVALADAAFAGHELTFQHGWDLAAAAVDKGEAAAAVLLRPATVAQIAETGRGGGRMPPKTTFFWPKPRTGLVFREVGAT